MSRYCSLVTRVTTGIPSPSQAAYEHCNRTPQSLLGAMHRRYSSASVSVDMAACRWHGRSRGRRHHIYQLCQVSRYSGSQVTYLVHTYVLLPGLLSYATSMQNNRSAGNYLSRLKEHQKYKIHTESAMSEWYRVMNRFGLQNCTCMRLPDGGLRPWNLPNLL